MFKDNLFSANHRLAMKQKYGYTDASYVTVEQLEKDQERQEIDYLMEIFGGKDE